MKMKKKNQTKIFLLFFFFALTGCRFSYSDIEFDRASKAAQSKKYSEAIGHYEKVMKKEPESALAINAAREAAKIALFETKQFSLALEFLKHLVLYSPDRAERISSQESMAFIYFDKLNQYDKAIRSYSQLLTLKISDDKRVDYELNIAKSFFYLNQFQQALLEIQNLLNVEKNPDKIFEINLFKASIYLAIKQTEDAVAVYRNLMTSFPEQASKEKVGISVSFAYEDINEFGKAIDILKEIRSSYPDQEFIDIKIKRLEQRMANLPGAKRKQ